MLCPSPVQRLTTVQRSRRRVANQCRTRAVRVLRPGRVRHRRHEADLSASTAGIVLRRMARSSARSRCDVLHVDVERLEHREGAPAAHLPQPRHPRLHLEAPSVAGSKRSPPRAGPAVVRRGTSIPGRTLKSCGSSSRLHRRRSAHRDAGHAPASAGRAPPRVSRAAHRRATAVTYRRWTSSSASGPSSGTSTSGTARPACRPWPGGTTRAPDPNRRRDRDDHEHRRQEHDRAQRRGRRPGPAWRTRAGFRPVFHASSAPECHAGSGASSLTPRFLAQRRIERQQPRSPPSGPFGPTRTRSSTSILRSP